MVPHYKALLVGNGDFDDGRLTSLRGPARDVEALYDALTDPMIGMFKAPDVEVLVDKPHAEIRRRVEDFFTKSSRPDDLLFFYYSGHGQRFGGRGHFALCAKNTDVDYRSTAVDYLTDVSKFIDDSNCERVIVILDCCYAGAAHKSALVLPDELLGRGTYTIAGTLAQQVAKDADISKTGLSPFTEVLLEGLRSGDANHDGYVSIDEVYRYTHRELGRRYKQTPQRGGKLIADMAIARSPSRRPPTLLVDPTDLRIEDARAGEPYAEQLFTIHNAGSGELNWDAFCHVDWIRVERRGDQLAMNLTPPPGQHSHTIHVCGHEDNSHVPVTVEIVAESEEAGPEPRAREDSALFRGLRIHPRRAQFGEVEWSHPFDDIVLQAEGLGRGEQLRVEERPPWTAVRVDGERVEVSALVSEPGEFEGVIVIAGRRGRVEIPVSAKMLPRPASISLSQHFIDLGDLSLEESLDRQLGEVFDKTEVDFGLVECARDSAPRLVALRRPGLSADLQLVAAPDWVEVDIRERVLELRVNLPAPRAYEGSVALAHGVSYVELRVKARGDDPRRASLTDALQPPAETRAAEASAQGPDALWVLALSSCGVLSILIVVLMTWIFALL